LLAKHLPNLSAVGFRFSCTKEGFIIDEWGHHLLSSGKRSAIEGMMLTLTLPFKHVAEINLIFNHTPLYTIKDVWPEDSPAVPWEDLVLECARLLDEERTLICQGIGDKKLELNVGNEGSLEESIWDPELFSNERPHNCYRCYCSLS
jgi:hypothetical protein